MSKGLSEEEVVKYWLNEIERAERKKQEWQEFFKVSDCYKYFMGDQRPDNYVEDEWFTLNLIYANIRAQIPSLYFKDPYFFVRLKRSYDPGLEAIQSMTEDMGVREAVLNYIAKENNVVKIGQLCILDAYFQFGCIKSRYIPSFEVNPDAGKPKKGSNGYTLKDDMGKTLREPEQLLVGERFAWERVNPNNILVDANAGSESFTWVSQKSVDFLQTVRCDPRLKNTDKNNLEPDALLANYNEEDSNNASGFLAQLGKKVKKRKIKDSPEEEQMVTTYEIYDISRGKMYIIAKNGKLPLLEAETPRSVKGHPFSFLKFDDNPGMEGNEMWYPIPPVFNQLGPQKEFGMACNDVAIHRKRYKRKYGYYEGVIDNEEIDKFEDPEDGALVRFNQPDWQTKFAPIQDAPLDAAVTFDRIKLRSDFDDVAGSSPAARGNADADTATEAQILETRLQIRESDKQFSIRRFLIDIAGKMHYLLEENLTTEGAIFVTGPKGEVWQPYGPANFRKIRGEIQFDIDVASMSPRNIQTERAQWLQFMNTVMQAPMVFADPEVLKWWAEKFDIHEGQVLQKLSVQLQQMMQMAQQQQGILQNMPGASPPPKTIGDGGGGAFQ